MAKESKNITVPAPPSMIGVPRVDFDPSDFDKLIYSKGYRVIWEKAVRCPCQSEEGFPLPSCQNCHGLGWLWVDPKEIRVVMQSLNKQTKYSKWSSEVAGTISLSMSYNDEVSYMDRISVMDAHTYHSELLDSSGGVLRPTYDIIDDDIWMYSYKSDNLSLNKISDFTYDRGIIHLSDISITGLVSVRYKCRMQYVIIDLSRYARKSNVIGDDGRDRPMDIAQSAVARLLHWVIDMPNNVNKYSSINNG